MANRMKAAIFVEPGRIVLDEKPIPEPGPLDALMQITTTTICGTDVHILKGEYPVARGLTIGHEPVGVIEKLGSAVQGYREGQRVIAGAITPSGYSNACLYGCLSQDGRSGKHGFKALGGWRFGNTIDGSQAEYVLVPDAMANLAVVPDDLTDEQVLMWPDIMSTGFAGAESGGIRLGDTVAVFAQGPIGLCASAGAKLIGATTVIGVDGIAKRQDAGAAHLRQRMLDLAVAGSALLHQFVHGGLVKYLAHRHRLLLYNLEQRGPSCAYFGLGGPQTLYGASPINSWWWSLDILHGQPRRL